MRVLPPALDAGARAMFSGPPSRGPVGAVYDLSLGLAPVAPGERWAAVVRSPDGYIVEGVYGSWDEANYGVERFWSGMRALLAPAVEPIGSIFPPEVDLDDWNSWRNANIPGGE